MHNKLFTSESVTEGHPDKLCDQVSDAILDAVIQQDQNSRVACETVATTGMVMVMGEMSTNCYVDIPSLVRKVVKDIGYTDAAYGFDYKTCSVMTTIDEQSPDIAMGVDNAVEHRSSGKDPLDLIGAGDQGMVFGYACTETPQFMPAPIMFSHQLTKKLSQVRKSSLLPFILPDGKSQVTVEYGEDGMPKRIDTVVISTQHSDDVQLATLREAVMEEVIKKTLPKGLLDKQTKYYINPTGRFVIGGPQGDSGLTGRKIIVDTYGGYSRHGGGAFSGKDPTKVDRSGAYMARYAAKNIVAAGLAQRCEIELAYAIGIANPVSVFVETFDTGVVPQERLVEAVIKTFDLRPAAIIKNLGLLRPLYRQTASYGHFGRDDIDLPWERLDKVEELKKYL